MIVKVRSKNHMCHMCSRVYVQHRALLICESTVEDVRHRDRQSSEAPWKLSQTEVLGLISAVKFIVHPLFQRNGGFVMTTVKAP